MRVTGTEPLSLYGTAIAEKDQRYTAWLGDFSNAAQRLGGSNPITDLALAKPTRRWFLAGLSPYEGVKRWQKRCGEGRHQPQWTVASYPCMVCDQPRPCGRHNSEHDYIDAMPYAELTKAEFEEIHGDAWGGA